VCNHQETVPAASTIITVGLELDNSDRRRPGHVDTRPSDIAEFSVRFAASINRYRPALSRHWSFVQCAGLDYGNVTLVDLYCIYCNHRLSPHYIVSVGCRTLSVSPPSSPTCTGFGGRTLTLTLHIQDILSVFA
jgi:hypothetical protein